MDANAQSFAVTTSLAGLPLPEEQQSSTQISGLADADLGEIFKRLPPYARLLASEVCRRWHRINSQAWLDVKHLDLSPIPGPNIAAVVKQCPNLQSVFAQGKRFALKELYSLSRQPNLRSVQLYKCDCLVQESDGRVNDAFAAIFSENLRSATWQELVWCDVGITADSGAAYPICHTRGYPVPKIVFPARSLSTSIRRLQLSRLRCPWWTYVDHDPDPLAVVECLIITRTETDANEVLFIQSFFMPSGVSSRPHSLRELFLGQQWWFTCPFIAQDCAIRLPSLEVLFLYNAQDWPFYFDQFITSHPRLRILVLVGHGGFQPDEDAAIPARMCYPNGLTAEPFSLLKVFVGKHASLKLRFTPSAALQVFPIIEPMPQFLEKEEIKPIFEGVWIAERIKEAAKQGEMFWPYEHDAVEPLSNPE